MPRPIARYSVSDIIPGVDCPWDGLPDTELTEQEIALAEDCKWYPDSAYDD